MLRKTKLAMIMGTVRASRLAASRARTLRRFRSLHSALRTPNFDLFRSHSSRHLMRDEEQPNNSRSVKQRPRRSRSIGTSLPEGEEGQSHHRRRRSRSSGRTLNVAGDMEMPKLRVSGARRRLSQRNLMSEEQDHSLQDQWVEEEEEEEDKTEQQEEEQPKKRNMKDCYCTSKSFTKKRDPRAH